ncbi:tetratricopeptide repeat protein [Streptomyces sp. SID13031]|uniref:tetratricopeptide repeat protein n=1 Tax=Streptomyces sp. SID13031 TaxID=2706046 RepID=UPI0013C6E8A6|nr:tetratricopeptide repeat protein [Streptomyces sp. SID13031]
MSRRRTQQSTGDELLVQRLLAECRLAIDSGDHGRAERMIGFAQVLSETADDAAVAQVALMRGLLAHHTGDIATAVESFEWLEANLSSKPWTPNTFEVLVQARTFLGSVRREQGRYSDAEHLLRIALTAAEEAPAIGPDFVSLICNELGMVFKCTGRFDLALSSYERALSLLNRADGVDHPAVATIYHNLAGLAHARGNYAAAEIPARRAVEIRQRTHGPDHIATVSDQAMLASILAGLGQLDEAEKLLRHALKVYKRTYGEDHYEVALMLNNLAAIAGAAR